MTIYAPDGTPVVTKQELERRAEEEAKADARPWHDKVLRSCFVAIEGFWFKAVHCKGDLVILAIQGPVDKKWKRNEKN